MAGSGIYAKPTWGLRVQCIALSYMVTSGLGPAQIAKGRNGCPVSVPRQTLQRWWRHFRDYGEPPEITRKHSKTARRRRIPQCHVRLIKNLLDDNPRLFYDEIQDAVHSITRVRYTIGSIGLVIKRKASLGGIGYSRKVLEERAAQASAKEQLLYKCCVASVPDPAMLVFLDESHKSRADGRRRYGYGPRGRSIIQRYLFDSSGNANYTLIAAVDKSGFIKEACRVVWMKKSDSDLEPTRGTVDTERFISYLEEDLLPVLGNFEWNEPRSVVILDNASIHKDPRVVHLIEGVGAKVIWTAPYSPWLNPIEHCFSFYKRRLARLIESVHSPI